jgi:hypothetical protein
MYSSKFYIHTYIYNTILYSTTMGRKIKLRLYFDFIFLYNTLTIRNFCQQQQQQHKDNAFITEKNTIFMSVLYD